MVEKIIRKEHKIRLLIFYTLLILHLLLFTPTLIPLIGLIIKIALMAGKDPDDDDARVVYFSV